MGGEPELTRAAVETQLPTAEVALGGGAEVLANLLHAVERDDVVAEVQALEAAATHQGDVQGLLCSDLLEHLLPGVLAVHLQDAVPVEHGVRGLLQIPPFDGAVQVQVGDHKLYVHGHARGLPAWPVKVYLELELRRCEKVGKHLGALQSELVLRDIEALEAALVGLQPLGQDACAFRAQDVGLQVQLPQLHVRRQTLAQRRCSCGA
mmetsp:Transcript_55004/g.170385  ORF Transcript_55004/g.170385 Transcript_55004/m.170385 type:complete len:207 (+) Transcript_55004:440-1060(+)